MGALAARMLVINLHSWLRLLFGPDRSEEVEYLLYVEDVDLIVLHDIQLGREAAFRRRCIQRVEDKLNVEHVGLVIAYGIDGIALPGQVHLRSVERVIAVLAVKHLQVIHGARTQQPAVYVDLDTVATLQQVNLGRVVQQVISVDVGVAADGDERTYRVLADRPTTVRLHPPAN